jgi:hypothetical protein
MIVSHPHRRGRTASLLKGSGFTFLEVLIALCVVVITLVPLIQLHVTSIRLVHSGSRMARATLLANAKLAEIVATDAVDIGESSGHIEEERGLVFQWRSTVRQADLAELEGTAISGIRRVHVDVSWQDGRRDSMVSADTFVCVPVQREQKDIGDQRNNDE